MTRSCPHYHLATAGDVGLCQACGATVEMLPAITLGPDLRLVAAEPDEG